MSKVPAGPGLRGHRENKVATRSQKQKKGSWNHSMDIDRDLPGGPMVKNPPSNARDLGSIPGQGTETLHAMGQLSQHVATVEPRCPGAPSIATREKAVTCNGGSCMMQLRPNTAENRLYPRSKPVTRNEHITYSNIEACEVVKIEYDLVKGEALSSWCLWEEDGELEEVQVCSKADAGALKPEEGNGACLSMDVMPSISLALNEARYSQSCFNLSSSPDPQSLPVPGPGTSGNWFRAHHQQQQQRYCYFCFCSDCYSFYAEHFTCTYTREHFTCTILLDLKTDLRETHVLTAGFTIPSSAGHTLDGKFGVEVKRKPPIDKTEWDGFFDENGHLAKSRDFICVNILERGLHPTVRTEAWKFLTGYYSWQSSQDERLTVDSTRRKNYEALCQMYQKIQPLLENLHRNFIETRNSITYDIKKLYDKDPLGNVLLDKKKLEKILLLSYVCNTQAEYQQGFHEMVMIFQLMLEHDHETFWLFQFFLQKTTHGMCLEEYLSSLHCEPYPVHLYIPTTHTHHADKMCVYKHPYSNTQTHTETQEHSCVINIGVGKNLDMLNTLIDFLDPVFAEHLKGKGAGAVPSLFPWFCLCFQRAFKTFDDVWRLWEACNNLIDLDADELISAACIVYAELIQKDARVCRNKARELRDLSCILVGGRRCPSPGAPAAVTTNPNEKPQAPEGGAEVPTPKGKGTSLP
ncbi:hypothetical protein MJG53_008122 [Ovis ammon polii x Ovis aries]|uniref:Uncharacterized protein n=1 Tax=Ovis ammon polii x Ovis aries TaxID=2918886 RepID=A0ACB9UZX2_9CETA|nr:hypothetical protein MJG53_008122 [Ovis ammon polii x Ovis aries]